MDTKSRTKSTFIEHLSLGDLGSLLGGFLGSLTLELLLGGAHEAVLLVVGLEGTVTLLGGGVNEAEVDGLCGETLGLRSKGLAEGDHTLGDARNSAADHDEVLTDNAVVGESAEGSNLLLGKIGFGGGVGLVSAQADAVDLVVGLDTVMVTILTSASDSPADAGRVPGANASDLAETLVSLAGEAASAPAGSDTLEALTLGDGNDVDEFAFSEDRGDGDGLLEVGESVLDLGGNVLAAVDLDLADVGLLGGHVELADLSMRNGANDSGVLADAVQITIDGLHLGLSIVVVLGVLGERLLLGRIPVLVEAAESLLTNVVGPHGGNGTETTGSLDVADDTDDDHGGSLDDGHGLADLLLVGTGAGTLDLTHNVGAASLVAHEGSEVGGLLGIVTRELSDASTMTSATLAGQETQRTVAGGSVLTVRHGFLLLGQHHSPENAKQDKTKRVSSLPSPSASLA